jgi:hypothetical protein
VSVWATFRKKPVTVSAAMLTWENIPEIGRWIHGRDFNRDDIIYEGAFAVAVIIHTLEGDMRANLGDWIIRGTQGEFYPCRPDIFAATYTLVV